MAVECSEDLACLYFEWLSVTFEEGQGKCRELERYMCFWIFKRSKKKTPGGI